MEDNGEEMTGVQPTEAAEAGRGGDTVMAHLSLGELVIPRAFLDDPQVMELMKSLFEQAGANINQYIVGDEANSINPETGYPEFGFFKSFGKIFKSIAPLALNLIPGIGTLGSIALGAGAGLLGGGGLKGALSGALGGFAGSGGASLLGKAVGSGLSSATQTALGSGLLGAASGGISGGGKGALLGGALGGLGGYANAGGFDDTAIGRGLQDIYTGASGALDKVSSGVSDLYSGSALQSGFKSGADVLKSAGFDTASAASTPALSVGGGPSSYGPQLPKNNATAAGATQVASSKDYISPALSALLGTNANNNAEEALLKQQRANQALLAPYTNGFSFTPGDLTQDPGYQFNLAEGTKAADRAQLARGGYFSGGAAKELSQFNQGLADNTYNTAFNRALQGRNAGLTGALAGAGVNENIGNIKANAATNSGNLLSGALGSILGGNSFTNTGALQGGNDIQALLRRLGIGNSAYAGA